MLPEPPRRLSQQAASIEVTERHTFRFEAEDARGAIRSTSTVIVCQ
jgi:hypothetical protein